MPKIIARHKGKDTEIDLPDVPGGFQVIVHDQDMRVDVPTFVEISCKTTLKCMEEMNQKQWEWISTGSLFKHLFSKSFDGNHRGGMPEISKTIDELNNGDMGIIHISGMIVQGCEAMFAGKNVFFRNPETLLHPATERMIVSMFKDMLAMCGGGKGTITAVGEEAQEQIQTAVIEDVKEEKALEEQVISWLEHHDQNKPFAKTEAGTVFTPADLILEVRAKTPIGLKIVEIYQSFLPKKEE